MDSARVGVLVILLIAYLFGTGFQILELIEAIRVNAVRKKAKENGATRVVARRNIHAQLHLLILNALVAGLVVSGLALEPDEYRTIRSILFLIVLLGIPLLSALLRITRKELAEELAKILKAKKSKETET